MPVDKLSPEQAASALNSGAVHLLRSLAAVDKLAGLTPARLSALSVLVFAGPQSLGALAATERVAGPTMTRIVDGLARSGLAERQPDPADGRAVLIVATAAGDTLMRAAAARRISAISAAIQRLPPADQRRLIATAGLLDQVAAAVLSAPVRPVTQQTSVQSISQPASNQSANERLNPHASD